MQRDRGDSARVARDELAAAADAEVKVERLRSEDLREQLVEQRQEVPSSRFLVRCDAPN